MNDNFTFDLQKIDIPKSSLSNSLVLRAFLALLLMISFYALAIGISLLLLLMVYLDLKSSSINVRLVIGGSVVAGVILWSIIPRIQKFVAPGILLRPNQHPSFFKLIAAIAEASGQKPPRDCYLTYELFQ